MQVRIRTTDEAVGVPFTDVDPSGMDALVTQINQQGIYTDSGDVVLQSAAWQFVHTSEFTGAEIILGD